MRHSSIINFILVGFILFILILPAIHPFSKGEMLRTDDGAIHVYRVIALEHAITTTGNFYPRYAPGLAYGYGSPLFNYFPPVPYYLPFFLSQLGIGYVQAWLVAFILYIYIASISAYLLGQIWSNSIGGFTTSISYVYAPYLLFDATSRGTIIEYAGLAVLPLVLWALTRLSKQLSVLNFILASLAFTIFIPLHNIVTLHGSLLIGIYALFLIVHSQKKWLTFLSLGFVGIIGVGMTTFFWLPALTETDNVKINVITENLANVDVTRYLRSLADILSPPQTVDPSHLQAPIPITLSWITIILSVGGGLILFHKRSKERFIVLFMLITALTVIFMNTPMSYFLWDNLPLIDYTQFAWRTLGIASLALAVATGIVISRVVLYLSASKNAQIAVLSVFTASSMLYAMPWLYTLYIDIPANSIQDIHTYERNTQELSLSSYSEYLPIFNQAPLDAEALIERYALTDTIPRSQHAGILNAKWRGTEAQLLIQLDEPETIYFDWLYVEGWQATLNNISIQPYPQIPQGLVALDIPAGSHELTIKLNDTQQQQFANYVSFFSLIIFAGFVLTQFFRNRNQKNMQTSSISLPEFVLWTIGITSFTIFATKILYIDTHNTLFKSYRFDIHDAQSGLKTPILADFSNGIRLIEASFENTVKSGEIADINIFATLVEQPINQNYSSQIILRDSENIVVAQSNSFMPGGIATSRWLPNTYTVDELFLEIPVFTPPDDYTLALYYYDANTQERASVINNMGNPIASEWILGTITVLPSSTEFAVKETYYSFEDANLSFVFVESDKTDVSVGDEIIVEILWQGQSDLNQDYQVKFFWEDNISETAVPLLKNYPTSQWQPFDMWRAYYRLVVPPDLNPGENVLSLQLFNSEGLKQSMPVEILSIFVNVPERTFALPEIFIEQNEEWKNGLELIGYNTTVDDTVTALTLYWRTQQQINENLHLFVQVLNDDSLILAQTDGIPVAWSRPTTGWLVGEIITTQHHLEVDLTENRVILGWYDPISNERQRTLTGDDFITLDIQE